VTIIQARRNYSWNGANPLPSLPLPRRRFIHTEPIDLSYGRDHSRDLDRIGCRFLNAPNERRVVVEKRREMLPDARCEVLKQSTGLPFRFSLTFILTARE